MRRGWAWHMGLGPELGNVFWAMVGVEAAFGAYFGIWPLWIEELGAPVTIVGFVLGSSGLLRLVALAPSAALGERFGARRLIVIARIVAGLGMIGAALATHWTHLFVMVLGSAVGEIAFPLIQSYVSARSGPNRVRAFTLVFNIGPAAALGLSPLVSGALVAVWGMRAAFLFGALCTVFSIFFFARLEPLPEAALEADAEAEPPPGSSYREALADRPVLTLLLLQFATIFVLALGTSFIPVFLEDVRGLTPATIAMLGGVGAAGSAIFGFVVTRVTRLQRSPLLAIAIAVGLVSLMLLIVTVVEPVWLIALSFLGRGGFFSAWTLFVAALGAVATERHRARSFALIEMMGGGGFSVAPMIAGQLYALRPTLPLLTAAVLGVILIPVLLRTGRLIADRSLAAGLPAAEPELA